MENKVFYRNYRGGVMIDTNFRPEKTHIELIESIDGVNSCAAVLNYSIRVMFADETFFDVEKIKLQIAKVLEAEIVGSIEQPSYKDGV